MQFAVGLKLKSKAEHVIVDAEDALIAALKVKAERPEAQIMYVRRQNRRGDTRNPPGRAAHSPVAHHVERPTPPGTHRSGQNREPDPMIRKRSRR